MERLSSHDYRLLCTFLEDLYSLRDHSGLIKHVLASMTQLIGCDRISYNEMDLKTRDLVMAWHPACPDLMKSMEPSFRLYMHQHPASQHVVRTRDEQALKVSDFLTLRQFQALEIHNEYYRHLQTNYQIALTLAVSRSHLMPIVLNRQRRDFSERDRLVLNLFRPHLVQAFHNAQPVTQWQARLDVMTDVLHAAEQGVVEVTQDGRLIRANRRAEQILGSHWKPSSGRSRRLPPDLDAWVRDQRKGVAETNRLTSSHVPLVLQTATGGLRIRLVRHEDSMLLFFQEDATDVDRSQLEQFRLTIREADVLHQIIQGKSNSEIGTALDISRRTVEKHTERIFDKLGVENRTAAIASVAEALRPA